MALNYQWITSATDDKSVLVLNGIQRAFLLSVATQASSYSWVNGSGYALTQEQQDIADVIMAESVEGIMQSIVGMIVSSPVILDGFLVCDGSAHSEATYPKLAALLGASLGSFTVPDLRNRFILGASFAKPIATIGGEENVTLSEAQMPLHSHAESVAVPFAGSIAAGVPTTYAVSGAGATGSAGASQPHTNMPPYYALLYLISSG